MGDALATMTLGTLAGEIWTAIGETDDATRLATLTIVEEVCVYARPRCVFAHPEIDGSGLLAKGFVSPE